MADSSDEFFYVTPQKFLVQPHPLLNTFYYIIILILQYFNLHTLHKILLLVRKKKHKNLTYMIDLFCKIIHYESKIKL